MQRSHTVKILAAVDLTESDNEAYVAEAGALAERLGGRLDLVYAAGDREAFSFIADPQVRDLLETMDARLRLMEDRQDFTERLLSSGERPEGSEARGRGPQD